MKLIQNNNLDESQKNLKKIVLSSSVDVSNANSNRILGKHPVQRLGKFETINRELRNE